MQRTLQKSNGNSVKSTKLIGSFVIDKSKDFLSRQGRQGEQQNFVSHGYPREKKAHRSSRKYPCIEQVASRSERIEEILVEKNSLKMPGSDVGGCCVGRGCSQVTPMMPPII